MQTDILSDRAYSGDDLGFIKYADVFSDIIRNTDELPFTVGIFGDWGSGKTTLMHMIQEQISETCKTVWFNAWKYDDKQYLAKALLKTIYDEAMKSTDINTEIIKDVLKRAADFTGQALTGKKLGTMFFETFNLDPAYRNLIEEATHEIIREYVGKDGRLVIFIDDLDRCLPENTITVLEAIKLYLDNEQCVIVLGVDRDSIETAIEQRYPKMKITGKDYLEKIVQIPFGIPQPDKKLMRKFLQKCSLPTGENLKEMKLLSEMLLSGSGLNMRRLKRLVNQLKLVVGMAGLESVKEMQLAVLTKLLVLQTRFPDFYDIVERHSDAIQVFHQVIAVLDDTKRKEIFARLPAFEAFMDNQPLCAFFRESAQVTCSDAKEVEALMQLTVMAK